MTFLNPYSLFGLLLVSVPVIIHLWFRKRLKKILFSSLLFLKNAEERRLKWLKLREILILICRCGFVATLFLALARPQLKSTFLKNRLASVYLIIDNSWSMAYGNNFSRMIEIAQNIIMRYSANSEFFVVPLCPQEELEEPFWTNRNGALQILKKIRLTYYSGQLKDVLMKYPIKDHRFPAEYLYLGDGQELVFKNLNPGDLRNFFWIKFPSGSNICITQVSLPDPITIPVDKYQLLVNIENFSHHNWRGTVEITANDFDIKQECKIPANEDLNLLFTLPIKIQRGIVIISEDSLTPDNRFFFSKSIPHKINLLLVGVDIYLTYALRPADRINSAFNIDGVNNLVGIDPRKYDVVILNGIKEISEGEAVRLETFLGQRNTGIIIFLGDELGENLKRFITRNLPIDILERVKLRGYATIDFLDFDYQPFSIFKETSGFRNIKFFEFFRTIANNGIRAKLSGNNPLVICNKNFSVVTTKFIEKNTDIMFHPFYIPFLHRMIYGAINRNPDNEYRIGDKIDTTKILKGHDGEYINKSELAIPGFYTLSGETIGVNIIPEEGNLKSLGEAGAKSLDIRLIDLEKISDRSDLSPFFLFCALVLILLEMILLVL